MFFTMIVWMHIVLPDPNHYPPFQVPRCHSSACMGGGPHH
jgi:hypothetical protein